MSSNWYLFSIDVQLKASTAIPNIYSINFIPKKQKFGNDNNNNYDNDNRNNNNNNNNELLVVVILYYY